MPADTPSRVSPSATAETICPFAKSDMTPCVIKDGEMSRADDGVCVGCERRIPQFRSRAEKRRYVSQISERIADDESPSPSSPVPSSETRPCRICGAPRGEDGRCSTIASTSPESLGELLKETIERGLEAAYKTPAGGYFGGNSEERIRIGITAAVAHVESYVSRLRDERDRLQRLETYVCQAIAMGNQADLTVESLPK